MHQKYNESGSGKLSLSEFSRLVAEFKAFERAADPAQAAAPQPAAQASRMTGARSESQYARGTATATAGAPPASSPRGETAAVAAQRVPEPLSEEEAARLHPPQMPSVAPPDPPPRSTAMSSEGYRPMSSRQGGGVQGARPHQTDRADRAASRGRSATDAGEQPLPPRKKDAPPPQKKAWDAAGGPPNAVVDHEGLGSGEDAHVVRLLADYAGGKTLFPSQHWVVRAMRALELRYQAAAREEAVQRFNLEVHANQLAHDLGAHQAALREAEAAQRTSGADAERARHALAQEQQLTSALQEHNAGLLRERDALAGDLERANGRLRSMKREIEALQARWQQASNEAGEWAQRSYEAQTETRAALTEASEARAAAAAVERSLLTAQEYRLAEEAGYQLQTIIQMAPSKATLTSVYELPQTTSGVLQSSLMR